ncbi:Global transcription regulator sge1 [Conglomerata obtusa]
MNYFSNLQIETFLGCVHTELDIIILIDLCQKNVLGRVTRRLHENEKRYIKDGSIFVYEESESKIKRWTDGKIWSPSRCNGIFLCYREYKPVGKYRGHDGKEMFKKTVTAKLKDKSYHIITYQNLEDEMSGKCCFKYGNRLKMIYEEFFGLENDNIKMWNDKIKIKNSFEKQKKDSDSSLSQNPKSLLNSSSCIFLDEKNKNANYSQSEDIENPFFVKSQPNNMELANKQPFVDYNHLRKYELGNQNKIFNENYFHNKKFNDFVKMSESEKNYSQYELDHNMNSERIKNYSFEETQIFNNNFDSFSYTKNDNLLYDDADFYLNNPFTVNHNKSIDKNDENFEK